MLDANEVEDLLTRSPLSQEVIQPYLNGSELNNLIADLPERFVINFRDWPLQKRKNDERAASDFPACLEIVEETVKPERAAIKGDYSTARYRREFWWRFSNDAEQIYRKLRKRNQMYARARISNTHGISVIPSSWACNEKTVVFAVHDFVTLQSSIHEVWIQQYASTLGGTLQYTTAGCFETFPFPLKMPHQAIGTQYDKLRSGVVRGI